MTSHLAPTQRQRLASYRAIFVDAKRSFFRHDSFSYASAIAYHATLSLAPLLLIAFSLISGFVDPATVSSFIVTSILQLFGQEMAVFVQDTIVENAGWQPENIVVTLIALGVTIYTSTNVFRQLSIALNNVWDVAYEQLRFRDDPAYWLRVRSRRYVLGLLFSLGLIVIIWGSLLLETAWGLLADLTPGLWSAIDQFRPIITLINLTIPALFWILLCLIGFRFLPNLQLSWRQIAVGALLTGITLALGQSVIGGFVGRSRIPSFYGVAGSLLIVLLWIYYSAIILLFGAEVTRAIADTRTLKHAS